MSVPAAAQRLDVVDLDAEDALHRQHVRPAIVPIDLGHVQQVRAREIALELRGVRGLAHQIELDGERPLELRDDLDGMQPVRFGPVALREPGDRVQHLDVALNQRARRSAARPSRRRPRPLAQARRVHLRDRGRRERLASRTRRTPARRAGRTRAASAAAACSPGERRHLILQLRELGGDVGRQQIRAHRQRLAELDEDRAELLERLAQAHAERQAPRGRTRAGARATRAAGTDACARRSRRARASRARAGSSACA